MKHPEMIEELKVEGRFMSHREMLGDPRMQALLKKDREYTACLRILQEHDDHLTARRAVLAAAGKSDLEMLKISLKIQATMAEIAMYADGLRWEIDRLLENTL